MGLRNEPVPEGNPSIISHLSLGANDLDRALTFYDAVLGALGVARVMQHHEAVAYGRAFPEFWVSRPHVRRPASAGNGVHVSFLARTPEQVRAFHAAGLAHGGSDDGPPGLRPQYTARYYAAFLRDPEGNKVEAMCWDAEPAAIEPAASAAS